MTVEPDAATLIDAYWRANEEIRRLEARRDFLKAQLLLALGDAPGEHAGASGRVRVGVLPTVRFPHGPVLDRLARAKLLPQVATISPLRLRRALDTQPAFEPLLADVVRRVDVPYLVPDPARGGA